ncbi:hypothetical protein IKF92_03655 [Candidatus Saccharibacteria bacterium]|nr:hypothetical protein [Candidatus Saccharibacteria bacterium]
MKVEEKLKVETMRTHGCSYGQIADLLKLPKSTVASYCQTNKIMPVEDGGDSCNSSHNGGNRNRIRFLICKNCGELFMPKTRRLQSYCSERCRISAWRKAHEDEIISTKLKKELEELDKLEGLKAEPYAMQVHIGSIPKKELKGELKNSKDSPKTLDLIHKVSDELSGGEIIVVNTKPTAISGSSFAARNVNTNHTNHNNSGDSSFEGSDELSS